MTLIDSSRLIRAALCAAIAIPAFSSLGANLPNHAEAPPISSLDPERVAVQVIRWTPSHDKPWHVTLDLSGEAVALELSESSVRSEGFHLYRAGAAGMIEVPAPPVTTHRGSILGDPSSLVAASFVEGGVRAVIAPGDGSLWYVQPRSEISEVAAPGEHVVYPASAVGDTGRFCGGAIPAPDRGEGGIPPGAFAPINCLRQADLALDLDYTYYQHHGSTTAGALADAESIVNGMNVIYNRDVKVNLKLGTTIVRTDGTLYNTSDIGTLLGMIQTEWTTTQSAVVRDVAHLFTGQPTGGVIGLAWVGVVCNFSYEYGVSNVDFTGDYASKVGLVSHEVGHNFNAGHCDGAPDCSIMCSGIGGCAGNLAGFSETSVGPIRAAANSSCMVFISGAPTQGGPGAIANSYTINNNNPIRLDVLGNDTDPNCDPISIVGFDTTTYAGATVSLSVGTGPSGRNELLYTPRPDAIGYDTFLYTIADGPGAQATARVYISNLTVRPADEVGTVEPGLEASYYRAGGATMLPDFSALASPFKTATSANLNYVRSSTNVVGSGRTASFAASFTGTLTVPSTDTWAIFAKSEDGSVVYIDGQQVVINDGIHSGMLEVSAPVVLAAGPHDFRAEYFDGSSSYGGLVVSWKSASGTKQVIPASAFGSGLAAEYFDLPAALLQLPSFQGRTPYKTSIVADLNQASTGGNFMDSERADEVLAAFDGYFVAPSDGAYTFYTESDDGSRLLLGDNTVVNNDGLHGMVEIGSSVNLQAGHHRLRVEFFENQGGAGLIVRVQGPGIDKQVIPASMLVHSAACPSDYNNDGFVTGEDFDAFVEDFVAGDAAADFNGDEFVNGDDFDEFVLAFEGGC